MSVTVTVSALYESPCLQTKNATQVHQRKATAWLLAFTLRPTFLICLGIRHGDTAAIDDPDVTSMPEAIKGNTSLQAIKEMFIDFIHHFEGDFGTGLTVSTSIWTHRLALLVWQSQAYMSHDLTYRFAARAIWYLNLIKKAPEDKIERKETLATVFS